jgi:TetR/AcrR family transcriptional regulator, tetracycline repressor protein
MARQPGTRGRHPIAGVAPPPWSPGPVGGRQSRADKPVLGREAIVEAAMRIIDAEGLDAVSMRRVAQEFETGAASLYAYVANKDELLDLVVDWIMGEVAAAVADAQPGAGDWQEQLKEFVRISRRLMASHRDAARAFLGRIPFGPNGLVVVERQLDILRAAGLPDFLAAFACDFIGQFLIGAAIEDELWRTRFPEGSEQDMAARMDEMRGYLAGLPPAFFPNLIAMAGPMTSESGPDGSSRFEAGLDVIVRGLASYAAKD